MKDAQSLHLKLQEMINCYMQSDLLKEMSEIDNEADKEEAAIKWLALAALHGINSNAEKIELKRSAEGGVQVTAEYREMTLPQPGDDVAEKIIEALRDITQIEGEKGKTPLAVGIRDSSVELGVKLKIKEGKEKISIKFPE